jgi:hypothetical protein
MIGVGRMEPTGGPRAIRGWRANVVLREAVLTRPAVCKGVTQPLGFGLGQFASSTRP